MTSVSVSIRGHFQWNHVNKYFTTQSFIKKIDIRLYLGPAMSYSTDDENILQVMYESLEEGEEALPFLHYHVPLLIGQGTLHISNSATYLEQIFIQDMINYLSLSYLILDSLIFGKFLFIIMNMFKGIMHTHLN
jgi:hypothetical protein